MCCDSNHQKSNFCSCQQNYLNNPVFWSKDKKINALEDNLKTLQEQEIEVKRAIEELKK
jgi:hypothetical protein